jgi:hypothetical protein
MITGAVAAFMATVSPRPESGPLEGLTAGGAGLIAMSLMTLAFAVPASLSASGGRLWMFGWRRPAGHDWLYLAPVVIACAIPANVWVPRGFAQNPASLAIAFGVATLAAVAVEAWFRGAVHGWFLFHGPIQRVSGPWMFSRAASVSTFFYILVYTAAALAWNITEADPFPKGLIEISVIAAAALAAGAALGMIRERSLSLWPGVACQILGGVVGVALALAGITFF